MTLKRRVSVTSKLYLSLIRGGRLDNREVWSSARERERERERERKKEREKEEAEEEERGSILVRLYMFVHK